MAGEDMAASTTVTRTISFPDEPEAILQYLAERTAETVGRRVARSSVVVLVRAAEPLDGTKRLTVERPLAGVAPGGELLLVSPPPTATGAPDAAPVVVPDERAVFFLVPAADVADRAYRLAGGRFGLVGGDATLIEQTAAAVEWFAQLPREPEVRAAALRSGLAEPNLRVARTAARALAEERLPDAAEALEEALPGAGDDLRVRLMLSLWLLGRRERALELLESFYASAGRDAWLAQWGLAASVDAQGRREAVLFGPDPAETRGD